MNRQETIAANLAAVEERIQRACDRSGRNRSELHPIVVTKTYPASDVRILAELGVRDVGENRHPEAEHKRDEVPEPLRWHFLGGLQTNKAGAVARYADMVHGVDRPKLARSLDRGAQAANRSLDCLIQIDFAQTDGRSGVPVSQMAELAELVSQLPHLRLRGVMAVAPLGVDPEPCFDQLQKISHDLQAGVRGADIISAGMSGDFEIAVKYGATHLRLGRVILGDRPPLQ